MSPRSSLMPLALAASFVSCGDAVRDRIALDRDTPIAFVTVTITQGERGSVAAPLPYAATAVTYTVHIEAQDSAGAPANGFQGFVSLSVTPGALQLVEGPGVQGRSVQLTNGVADGVRLTFARAYGETRVWAEEEGYVPVDPNRQPPAQCADGIDNDADGRIDFPADYGCAAPNDDTERDGSYAIGTSEPIYFASPRVSDIQGHASTSPLVNERVTVTAGTMIVTRISNSGFWVTDTADTSCSGQPCFNHLFAFNFNLPNGLRPCDRLQQLQGTVAEFVSTTQLAQPGWTIAPDGLWIDQATSGACPIPDPTVITPMMLASAAASLEPVESGLVRVENAALAPNIGPARPICTTSGTATTCDFAPGRSNCDANGDGVITFTNPTEGACASACQTAAGCSEWTNWTRFGQLAVDLPMQAAGTSRLVVAPQGALPGFDPARPPAALALAITGTLKQVGPSWVIEPRCEQDFVLPGGTIRTTQESCLQPRTINEGP